MWNEVQRLASNLKIRYLTLSLLFCVLLWFGIRGCSGEDKEKILYRIGKDNTWYNTNLFGKERHMSAFVDELMVEIAENQGYRVEVVPTTGSVFENIDRRNFDGVISNETISSLGIAKYQYSQPFYLLGPVLIVGKDSKITSISDLNEKSIGVALNSTLTPQISAYSAVFKVYDNAITALDDLNTNRIDGVLINVLPGYVYSQAFYSGKMRIIPTKVKEGLKLIVKRDPRTADLIRKFNAGLEELKKNGRYNQLIEKWGLINTDIELDPKSATP